MNNLQKVAAIALIAALPSCKCGSDSSKSQDDSSPTSATEGDASALKSRGKTVYLTNCIACHNSDPAKPGSIGPEVFGSSRDLLEARIMRAEYPAGYTPKRTSSAMAKMPQLAGDIDALHAFLN